MSEFFDAIEKGKKIGEVLSLNIIPEDPLEKAKYLTRVGYPGHYTYTYREKSSSRLLKSSVPESAYQEGVSTTDLYMDNINGKVVWDAKRVKDIHDPIISAYTSRAVKSENPTVYLMMGAPGSGKGTILDYMKKMSLLPGGVTVVDPDDIKSKWGLKEDFDKYSKVDSDKAAQRVHEEGSYLAKRIINNFCKIKSDVVIDKTFVDYNSLTKMVNKFKKAGYKVEVNMAYQTDGQGHKNIAERFARIGRNVPIEFSKPAYRKIGPTSEKFVKHLPEGVGFQQWHSKVYNEPPVKLFEKKGGKQEGTMILRS